MPIVNVRVQQRFGIISHKQRLDIQQRLFAEAERSQPTRPQSGKSQLETLEDFATAYGACPPDERSKYDEIARTMIETVKRSIGHRSGGVGSNVNLPFGWTKLTLLAQCDGWIQSECMALLLTSLYSAPLAADQIPVLVYTAELMLYLLRSKFFVNTSEYGKSQQSSKVSEDEIKLLKIIELSLFRLYYFKLQALVNDTPPQFTNEQFAPLKQYVSGLEACESRYQSYPAHEYSFSLIVELGSRLLRSRSPLDVDALPIVRAALQICDLVQRQTASKAAANDLNDSIHALEKEFRCFMLNTDWFESIIAMRFLMEPCARSGPVLDVLQRFASQSLHEWVMPVVLAYADLLFYVALYGLSADLRQRALLGFRRTKSPDSAVAYFTNANLHDKLVARTNEQYADSNNADGDLLQLLIFGLKSDIHRRPKASNGVEKEASSTSFGGASEATATMSSSSMLSISSCAMDAPFKIRAFALYCVDALRELTFGDAMRDGVNRFMLALVQGMQRYEPVNEVLTLLTVFNVYTLVNKEATSRDTEKAKTAAMSRNVNGMQLFGSMAQLLIVSGKASLADKPSIKAKTNSRKPQAQAQTVVDKNQAAKAASASRPCDFHKPAISLQKSVDLASALRAESKPDNQSRVVTDLRRVIEDQWRKELHRELDSAQDEDETTASTSTSASASASASAAS